VFFVVWVGHFVATSNNSLIIAVSLSLESIS
jgi:hypothetical protein